jgi:hypothetical protein
MVVAQETVFIIVFVISHMIWYDFMYDIMDFYDIKVAQETGNYDIIHDIIVLL